MNIDKAGETINPGKKLMLRCLVLILLFSAWPLLNFIYRNQNELDLDGVLDILQIYAITIAIACSAFFAIHLITRRSRPIAGVWGRSQHHAGAWNNTLPYLAIQF
jgi:hypothetical protein